MPRCRISTRAYHAFSCTEPSCYSIPLHLHTVACNFFVQHRATLFRPVSHRCSTFVGYLIYTVLKCVSTYIRAVKTVCTLKYLPVCCAVYCLCCSSCLNFLCCFKAGIFLFQVVLWCPTLGNLLNGWKPISISSCGETL